MSGRNQTSMFGLCEAIMEEDSNEEELSLDNDEEDDNLSIRSANTDTEQELSDEEESIHQEQEKEESCCIGKDGQTTWYSDPEQVKITPRSNKPIIPGVKLYARKAKSELECWNLFITNDMMQEILKHSNAEINSRTLSEAHLTRLHVYKEMTMDELMAVFGLMYIAGLNNTKGNNLTDLWRSDGTGVDIFRMTMSLQRFNFLQSCLRFDDVATANLRSKLDNISPIRSLFDQFTTNCQKSYKPSECLTIDERYIKFRGKCSFRKYMPNTSAAYGIKMYALVDPKEFFTVNLEIHAGKQPEGPFSVSNDPFDVVDRLVAPISKTNRNVTVDNRFTSVPLAQHLLSEHGLTITGAMRKSKEEVPQQFKNVRRRAVNSAQFGFHDDLTLVSYVPKKNNFVLLLSSLHHDKSLDAKGEKPEIVSYYNSTKNGVEVVDKLCATYDVRICCKRWPMLILFTMMNIAAINAVIVYRENNKSKVRRSEFIRLLGLALLNQHLIVRKNKDNLPRELRKRIYEQMGETLQYPPKSNVTTYKRCRDCPSSKDRKTKYTCIECQKPICLQHVVVTCQNCSC